jgi:hypothetical protein
MTKKNIQFTTENGTCIFQFTTLTLLQGISIPIYYFARCKPNHDTMTNHNFITFSGITFPIYYFAWCKPNHDTMTNHNFITFSGISDPFYHCPTKSQYGHSRKLILTLSRKKSKFLRSRAFPFP